MAGGFWIETQRHEDTKRHGEGELVFSIYLFLTQFYEGAFPG